jgi:hypothetical protein
MPYYDSLSETSQNLVMLNFEFMGKILLIGIALIFSIYYIFSYWKTKKESPYILVGIGRLLLYICSITVLGACPLLIFLLYPQVGIDIFLQYMLIFYTVGFFVAGAIVLLNILWHGTNILVSFANVKINPESKKVKKLITDDLIKMMGFGWVLKMANKKSKTEVY